MRQLLPTLLLMLLLSGCLGEEVRRPSEPPKRVLLVILAGDNNLSKEVPMRLEALKAGWRPGMGPLYVLEDRAEAEAPRLLRLSTEEEGAPRRFICVKRFPELENSASPQLWSIVMERLLSQLRPDSRLGLVVFSHGSGWLPEGMLIEPRSFLMDKEREMSLEGLVNALPSNRLDFIAFDMCFTAGVEVTYALRKKVPLLLVSSAEMLSPGFTPLYRSSLEQLYGPQPEGLREWGRRYAAEVERQEGVYRSGTLSLIATGPLEDLAEALRGMTIPEAREGMQRFDRWHTPPLFYDLGEVIDLQEPSCREAAGAALKASVLYEWHTWTFLGYLPIHHHSGLTIYLPSDRYPQLNAAYLQTEWGKVITGSI